MIDVFEFMMNLNRRMKMKLYNFLIIKSFKKDYSNAFQSIMDKYGYYNHTIIKAYNPNTRTINYLIIDTQNDKILEVL